MESIEVTSYGVGAGQQKTGSSSVSSTNTGSSAIKALLDLLFKVHYDDDGAVEWVESLNDFGTSSGKNLSAGAHIIASGGGGSGVDMDAVWTALAASTSNQINKSHLTNALAGYITSGEIPSQLSDLVDDLGDNVTSHLHKYIKSSGAITEDVLPDDTPLGLRLYYSKTEDVGTIPAGYNLISARAGGNGRTLQIAFGVGKSLMYRVRSSGGNTWLDWRKVVTDKNFESLIGDTYLKSADITADLIKTTLGTTAVNRATADGSGNTISSTYLKTAALTASLIISALGDNAVNVATHADNATKDSAGNIISSTYLKSAALTAALIKNTLGTTAVNRATADASGNTISSTYLKSAALTAALIVSTLGNTAVAEATHAVDADNAADADTLDGSHKADLIRSSNTLSIAAKTSPETAIGWYAIAQLPDTTSSSSARCRINLALDMTTNNTYIRPFSFDLTLYPNGEIGGYEIKAEGGCVSSYLDHIAYDPTNRQLLFHINRNVSSSWVIQQHTTLSGLGNRNTATIYTGTLSKLESVPNVKTYLDFVGGYAITGSGVFSENIIANHIING